MTTRDDWKALPMPEARESASLQRQYSAAEFLQISSGVIPHQMEDKWFIFYEEPWLFIHRSWTGFCIYQVRFESSADGASVSEVVVNRDPSQHAGDFDLALLTVLLDSHAGRDTRSSMASWVKSRHADKES